MHGCLPILVWTHELFNNYQQFSVRVHICWKLCEFLPMFTVTWCQLINCFFNVHFKRFFSRAAVKKAVTIWTLLSISLLLLLFGSYVKKESCNTFMICVWTPLNNAIIVNCIESAAQCKTIMKGAEMLLRPLFDFYVVELNSSHAHACTFSLRRPGYKTEENRNWYPVYHSYHFMNRKSLNTVCQCF